MKFNSSKTAKTTLFVFLSVVLFFNYAIGQSEQSLKSGIENKNAVFIEGLGHGFVYSLNYERILFGNSTFHTAGQIGISYYGKKSGIVPLWVPISLNQSIRVKGNAFLEIGIGKMFRNDGVQCPDGTFVDDYQLEDWIFRFGYKHYFKSDKWLLKIAYTPNYQDKSCYVHWGGIAFGYRF